MVQKLHPMWLLIFTLFGLSLALFFNMVFELIFVPKVFSLIFLVLSIIIGFIVFLKADVTPSKAIGFQKSDSLTLAVWFVVILSIVLLLGCYIFDTFIFLI